MNCNPDYNKEMLKLYFAEKNFSKSQIEHILNNNPFNSYFINWEKGYLYANKILADTLKKKGLINMNDNIHEIVNDVYNSIGKYLFNNMSYASNVKDYIPKDSLILVRDTINSAYTYAEELCKMQNRFITGICTRNRDTYEKKLELYEEIRSNENDIQVVEAEKNDLSICLIKKCR